jgi:RimJ/RimL family protein N-acetyltransferase
MHSRQGAPQGRLGAGGAPASARTSPAPSSDALGSAADPAEQVTLRDGVTVLLRPARVDDAAATRFLFQGLSERSTWLRFFTVCPRLDRVIDWATKVDNDRRLGVVAYDADTGRLIAHAGLERDPRQPDRAEFALVVADHYQGCGLGGMLLGRLVEAAQRVGIRWLTAEVLAENHRMLNLLRHSYHPVSLRLSYGVVLAELPTSPSPGTGLVSESSDAAPPSLTHPEGLGECLKTRTVDHPRPFLWAAPTEGECRCLQASRGAWLAPGLVQAGAGSSSGSSRSLRLRSMTSSQNAQSSSWNSSLTMRMAGLPQRGQVTMVLLLPRPGRWTGLGPGSLPPPAPPRAERAAS